MVAIDPWKASTPTPAGHTRESLTPTSGTKSRYDELEVTDEAIERVMSDEHRALFAELGLPEPEPVPVQPLHHQIAQKLHACTENRELNDRARDLVDLQLLRPGTDPAVVAATARRLFRFRRIHDWPPEVISRPGWDSLYTDAAHGLDVLPTVDEALAWVAEYIEELRQHP